MNRWQYHFEYKCRRSGCFVRIPAGDLAGPEEAQMALAELFALYQRGEATPLTHLCVEGFVGVLELVGLRQEEVEVTTDA